MNQIQETIKQLKNEPKTTVEYITKRNKIVEIRITIEKYPTHAVLYAPKTDKGKLKTSKINGQNFYNGKIATFNRNITMQQLHQLYYNGLKNDKVKLKRVITKLSPIKIKMGWFTVPNHETVKVLRNKLFCGEIDLTTEYNPSFDCDNQFPYFKSFQDTLTKDLKVLPDDNVKYVPNTGEIEYTPVKHFDDRKLVFTITKHNQRFKDIWLEFFKFWK